MDFIRGASLSEGGKPIIALPSTTKSGISKLVPTLKVGAGVVTTRAHVHYVVTEYGIADLYGKNIAQRAKAIIQIAHPNHREELERQSYDLYGKCCSDDVYKITKEAVKVEKAEPNACPHHGQEMGYGYHHCMGDTSRKPAYMRNHRFFGTIDFRPGINNIGLRLVRATQNVTMQYVSAEEAVGLIKNNERVFIHGGCATPERLVNALTHRNKELSGIEITHMHTEGEAPYARPEFSEAFHVNAFFIAKNIRQYVNEQHVQYIPMFLSEIPMFIRSGKFPIDTALIHVSPPDQHGYCSLGVSVDIARSACDMATKIIALVNPRMPRTIGDSMIHVSRITA
ncbi:unnamed protein product, partial [Darwinula stevensoni]